MPAFQGCRQALIVACQTPKSAEPAEGALNDPASRQQHETSLGFIVLDDDEFNPVIGCRRVRVVAGVALIDKGNLDFAIGHLLHAFCHFFHLAAIAFVGRRHFDRKQVSKRIDSRMDLIRGEIPPNDLSSGGTFCSKD